MQLIELRTMVQSDFVAPIQFRSYGLPMFSILRLYACAQHYYNDVQRTIFVIFFYLRIRYTFFFFNTYIVMQYVPYDLLKVVLHSKSGNIFDLRSAATAPRSVATSADTRVTTATLNYHIVNVEIYNYISLLMRDIVVVETVISKQKMYISIFLKTNI